MKVRTEFEKRNILTKKQISVYREVIEKIIQLNSLIEKIPIDNIDVFLGTPDRNMHNIDNIK